MEEGSGTPRGLVKAALKDALLVVVLFLIG